MALAVAAASALLYLPSLQNGFVWDDRAQVLANRWLTGWRHLGEIFGSGVWDFESVGLTNYYRPLMHVGYLAVYSVFGPAAWAFHLLQVLLNGACAALVVLLAAALLGDRTPADAPLPARVAGPLAAGVVFAFHPVHSEAVLWVAALSELGATACALGAALLYLRALRGGDDLRPYVAAAALFLAGALFKETAAVAAPFLLLCDLALAPRDPLRARIRRLAPFFVAGLAYLALRHAALGEWVPVARAHGQASAGWAALPVTFGRYLAALAWPFPLDAYWESASSGARTAAGLAALLASAGFLAALAATWWRDRAIALGLALCLLALLPAFFTSAISGARLAERYLYLPSAGAAIAVAAVAGRLAAGSPRLVAAGLGLLAAVASVAISLRIPVWRDERALWSDTVAKSPGAAEPRYNLGIAQLDEGDLAGAAEQLDAALRLRPEPVLAAAALNDLGRIAERAGRSDVALEYFRRAVGAFPDSAAARANLGGALAERGRLEEALPHLATAARLRPQEPATRLNLALVLLDLGRRTDALAELAEAARLAPGDAEIQARLLAERSRPSAAGGVGP